MRNTKISWTDVIYGHYLVFVFYCIVLPIVGVCLYGFFLEGSLTIEPEIVMRALKYLVNSLVVALPVTFIAMGVAVVLAFTLWRISFVGRGFLRILALTPLVNPPFVGSIAFIMLFGRRGLITYKWLGLSVSPYGPQGVIIMQCIALSSLAYLLLSSAIQKTDIQLEQAARNLGAKELEIIRDITLPMMHPEMINTALLVFLSSLADFGTPLIIGGDFQTLASDLYIQITGLYDMRSASISGVVLLVPCIAAFVYQKYRVSARTYYSASVLQKDIEYKMLPSFLRGGLIFISTLFIAVITLKYGFIIIGAFTKHWGYDYTLTLAHFDKVWSRDLTPFLNSLYLAFGVALAASFTGVLLAYMLKVKEPKGGRILDFLVTLPAAIPGILLGIGYLVVFKYPLLGIGRWYLFKWPSLILLGTGMIIYLICIFRYMNIGLRTGYALLEHIDESLEKAAVNLGASAFRAFWDILFPQLKPAFSASFFKIFSTTMTTLGAIIFLLLPKNKVAVQQIFQIITSSELGFASAMALLLSWVTLVFLGLMHLVLNGKTFICKLRRMKA